MMIRRLGLLLVGAITTLALAACGGTATPSPASSAATAPSVAASTAPSVAASAGGSAAAAACTTAPAGGTAKVTVTIKDFSFSPEPVQAKVGDVIAWTNSGNVSHTATLDDNSCSTDTLASGATGSLVFSAPGTYAYHCKIHPTQMKGTIQVT
jgi:plastocyanin